MKIVFCTPSIYLPGGVERVLTTKVNYFADVLGYDVTVILTDGYGCEPYFPLSQKVKVINFNIGFEAMWSMSIVRKGIFYLRKQRLYKKLLRQTLLEIRPDITISTGRREVNFLCDIPDGSKKLCEIHVNRAHYRNFEGANANLIKNAFARYWMRGLVKTLNHFDRVVCLTPTDASAWTELSNVVAIPNPLPPTAPSKRKEGNVALPAGRVIAVGRYVYQKGFDILIDAWKVVSQKHPDWHLDIYGAGEREPYQQQVDTLGLNDTCLLHGADANINARYAESDILAVSSRFEGFGMIIIEAMAQGCVPVSFNCPYGPSDIITDGKDGWLVENGSVEAMASRLCYVIEHKDELNELASQAEQTASKYSVENIAKRWTQIFDELCPGR
ncbi:MAG: glycosyltransferase family 4 protein [Bacteroidaceae bacterium]|nr:glycosyltransferase family 4 protein [Bacteroidaceae bacterium]